MTMDGPTPMASAEGKQAEVDRDTAVKAPSPWRQRWNGMTRWQQWIVLLIPVALVYALPVLNPPIISTEPAYNFPLACFDMARFALIAIGLNIVVGYAGLLDLGYIAFFAVGAYTAAMATSPDSPYLHIPYLWTLPLAIAVTMLFGVMLGVPTLRLRGDYLAIVTLGFGEIIRILATIIPAMKGNVGFQGIGSPPGTDADGNKLFVVSNGLPWYWLAVTIIIIVLLLVGNLERSRVGRNWIAIREDEDAAEAMGVPTFKYKVWAFALGAGVGGLSGALYAGQIGFVNNQKFDVVTSILFLAAVVMGGTGNKVGAIVGGALVAYLPTRFTEIADYKYFIFGLILVILMLFRPQGLFPGRMQLLTYATDAYHRLWPAKLAEHEAAKRAATGGATGGATAVAGPDLTKGEQA